MLIKLSVLFPQDSQRLITCVDSSALRSWLFAADYYDSISVEIVFSLPDKSSYFSENLGSVVEFHHTDKFHFVRNTYNDKVTDPKKLNIYHHIPFLLNELVIFWKKRV